MGDFKIKLRNLKGRFFLSYFLLLLRKWDTMEIEKSKVKTVSNYFKITQNPNNKKSSLIPLYKGGRLTFVIRHLPARNALQQAMAGGDLAWNILSFGII